MKGKESLMICKESGEDKEYTLNTNRSRGWEYLRNFKEKYSAGKEEDRMKNI